MTGRIERRRHRLVVALPAVLVALLLPPATAGAHGSRDAVAPALGEWVQLLEGGWEGDRNETPFGSMPFAMLFERQPDGSLRSFSAFHRETWIEMSFLETPEGEWRMAEAASLEGNVHRRTLRPAGVVGSARRWVSSTEPDELAIDMAIEGPTLDIDVWLRGRSHAHFELTRVPQGALGALRDSLAAQARRSPEEAGSLIDLLSERPAAPAESGASAGVNVARDAVANAPDDARAHMKLAEALIDEIGQNPGRAPTLSRELLESLETAHALDRDWAAPYHGLIGYYLNAPRIAGGSLDKARSTAQMLAEVDPEAGRRVLDEIDTIAKARAGEAEGPQ